MTVIDVIKIVAEVGSIGTNALILVGLYRFGHRLLDMIPVYAPQVVTSFVGMKDASEEAARESRKASVDALAAKSSSDATASSVRTLTQQMRKSWPGAQSEAPSVRASNASSPSITPA
jgi:hypothetical protein